MLNSISALWNEPKIGWKKKRRIGLRFGAATIVWTFFLISRCFSLVKWIVFVQWKWMFIEIGKISGYFYIHSQRYKRLGSTYQLEVLSFFFSLFIYFFLLCRIARTARFRNSHDADTHSVQSRLADGIRLPETACISAINHAYRIKWINTRLHRQWTMAEKKTKNNKKIIFFFNSVCALSFVSLVNWKMRKSSLHCSHKLIKTYDRWPRTF